MKLTGIKVKHLVLSLIVVSFLVAYGLWQSREILRGPVVLVDIPGEGRVLDDSYTEIKGQVANVAFIELNGRKIYTETDGTFKESVLLPEGYSVVQIQAKDRFGETVTKNLELVVNSPDTSTEVAHKNSETSKQN